jgi:hypothetical protein
LAPSPQTKSERWKPWFLTFLRRFSTLRNGN